jgi:UDP-glucose 4-epimerase
MTVLVTGGAGYIGSHVARLILERGAKVVIADDLSTGLPSRVENLEHAALDLAAHDGVETIRSIIRAHGVESVIHLAARKKVGESVDLPEWYYQQNIGGLANLLAAMKAEGVNRLVFSSSAATYGMPDVAACSEDRDRLDQATAIIYARNRSKFEAQKVRSPESLGDLNG